MAYSPSHPQNISIYDLRTESVLTSPDKPGEKEMKAKNVTRGKKKHVFTDRHGVTSARICVFSKASVRTSHLRLFISFRNVIFQ